MCIRDSANLEATLESAIQTPGEIPGLVSNLVYGLLSPNPRVGLFGQLLDNAVNPATWLPAPIGQSTDPQRGLANEIRHVIDDTTNGILSVLPTPVRPSAAQDPPAELPTGTSAPYGDDAAPAAPKSIENTRAPIAVKVQERPAKPTHRTAGSLSDRVTRVLTRPAQDKPAKTASSRAAAKASRSAQR